MMMTFLRERREGVRGLVNEILLGNWDVVAKDKLFPDNDGAMGGVEEIDGFGDAIVDTGVA